MNVKGIGVDLALIPRVREVVRRWDERFLRRVFTDEEIAYCQRRRDPIPHFAARFAAKEATLKALGTGLRMGIRWREIEVRRERGQAPTIVLTGRCRAIALARGRVPRAPLASRTTATTRSRRPCCWGNQRMTRRILTSSAPRAERLLPGLAVGLVVLVQGCAGLIPGKQSATADAPGGDEAFQVRKGRPGMVIGAPPGVSDAETDAGRARAGDPHGIRPRRGERAPRAASTRTSKAERWKRGARSTPTAATSPKPRRGPCACTSRSTATASGGERRTPADRHGGLQRGRCVAAQDTVRADP